MPNRNQHELIAKFVGEWNVNRRLRVGIYLLIGILWLYAILVLKDFVVAEHASWEAMESKNLRSKATAAAADWPTRAQEIKAALTDLEALLWRDGSVGLSQAAFEERITQSFASASIVVRSIRASAIADTGATPALPDLIQLRARIQADFRPTTFYPWLASMARSKSEKSPSLLVESLTIRSGSFGQPATADLELVGYAVKASGERAGVSK